MRVLVMAAMLLFPLAARAQTVDITLNPEATAAGLDEAALEGSLNDAIANKLDLGTQQQYDTMMGQMVEASAISTKGMGVDYASNIEKFMFGGALGSGVQEAGFTFNRGKEVLPRGGYAAHLSLMAGVNLGMGGDDKGFFDHVRIYVNGMALKMPSRREFGGRMANVGGHIQLKLVGGPDAKLVEWGGLDLTSGFEYSNYTFELLSKDVAIPAPMGGSGGDLTWTATGEYDISTDVMAVPVELSTNLRVAVITAYLGGAYDYNIASGTSNTALAGPLDGKLLAPDGSTYDGELGTAEVTANATGVAVPNTFRIFLGAQANVLVLKGFAHLNIAPLNGALGGHVGIRVAL